MSLMGRGVVAACLPSTLGTSKKIGILHAPM